MKAIAKLAFLTELILEYFRFTHDEIQVLEEIPVSPLARLSLVQLGRHGQNPVSGYDINHALANLFPNLEKLIMTLYNHQADFRVELNTSVNLYGPNLTFNDIRCRHSGIHQYQ